MNLIKIALAAALFAAGGPTPARASSSPGSLPERTQLELRVLAGAAMRLLSREYGAALGFSTPFTSRWAVGGSVGIKLGTTAIYCADADAPETGPMGWISSDFRLPISVDVRWTLLDRGNWIAQVAAGAEASYVSLEGPWTKDGLTIGPSFALQLSYPISERVHARFGGRYVAEFFASAPSVTVRRAFVDGSSPDAPLRPLRSIPFDRVRHALQGFVAIDVGL